MGPQRYEIKKNLLSGETLQIFEKIEWSGGKTTTNYELFSKGLMNHFFPLKAIKRHTRYLHRGLFKLQNSKIFKFICCTNEIIEFLDQLPPFGTDQVLQD